MFAFSALQAAQPSKTSGEQEKPLTPEKGDAGEVNVPEMPVYEQMDRTASQEQQVQNYLNGIDSRMQRLINEYNSALAVVRKQQEKALKDSENSMVFNRDFAMELMQFQDVTELLFGENSNYGNAITSGGKLLEQNSVFRQRDLPAVQQHLETIFGGDFSMGASKPTEKPKEGFNYEKWKSVSDKLQDCVYIPGEKKELGNGIDRYGSETIVLYNPEQLPYYLPVNPSCSFPTKKEEKTARLSRRK